MNGGQLAGGNSTSKKADNDFYTTNSKTVELFLERFVSDKNELKGEVWECACGTGNISEVLRKKFPNCKIISTDLVDRGYGIGNCDFLQCGEKADAIITNPPFSLINDFIKKGLELSRRYLIFLAKIQTLETASRKELLEKSPLRYIYVHSTRQATWKNNRPKDENGKQWATTMCLAWFVWDKEYKGEPVVKFL